MTVGNCASTLENYYDKRSRPECSILTWKNLKVQRERTIATRILWKRKIQIVTTLFNVSGIAQSGKLMAIMGPSGSGKTTLLTVLSGRSHYALGGTVMLNGVPVTSSSLTTNSGFAPQRDLYYKNLTIVEHLMFTAALKLNYNQHQNRTKIDQILVNFGIFDCRNTQIKSLSGGERKRVSLCVEVLNDPPILFCDEPTTGLDSWVAASVVQTLRGLAESGMMVICSIHQPTSGIFEQFHNVMFLADGRTAFHGSTADAAKFIGGLGFQCPLVYNQAEYYINLLSVSRNGQIKNNDEQISFICKSFEKSEYAKETRKQIKESEKYSPIDLTLYEKWRLLQNKPTKRGLIVQLRWLLWRSVITTKRSMNIVAYNFFAYMIVACLIVVPYINVFSILNQRSVQNVGGMLYLTVSHAVYLHVYGTASLFSSERPILQREVTNGLYSAAPYYFSKIVILMLQIAFKNVFYGSILFWFSGLRGGFGEYMLFVLTVFLCAIVGNAYGLMISSLFDSMKMEILVSVPFQVCGSLFSGFFLKVDGIPVYLRWIKYITMYRNGFEMLSILEWRAVDRIDCEQNGQPCLIDGTEVLDSYGFSVNNFYFNLTLLIVYFCVCHTIGYIMIRSKSKLQAVY